MSDHIIYIVHFILFRMESDLTPHKNLKEEVEAVMMQFMILVQYKAVSFISLWVHILISHCYAYSVV